MKRSLWLMFTVLLVLPITDSVNFGLINKVIPKSLQKVKLNMAPNTVDNIYTSCSEKMLKKVPEILANERKQDKDFDMFWKTAEKSARKDLHTTGLTLWHIKVLYLYSMEMKTKTSGKPFYQIFNNAVRNTGKKNFPYKSAHFLLTDAIGKLKENERKKKLKCVTTYRGTKLSYEIAAVETEFRFGAFTSSSISKTVAQRFGREICFIITTCFGANITPYSAYKGEAEVLIPPYEKFKVTNIFPKGKGDMYECDVTYKVKSSGIQSNHVCSSVDNGSV